MSEQPSIIPFVIVIINIVAILVATYLMISGIYKYEKYRKLGELPDSILIKKSMKKVIIGLIVYLVPVVTQLFISI
ncbi:MAG: hypothetical protein NTV95_03985 [Candidatus Saccharibacteria bacterium]|nr:hypothetical protein [Candidatus Saccharibacteria bacterium]